MYILELLRTHGVWYEALLYQPASSSSKRAGNAHVPGRNVAKTVLIKAADQFLVAVLPATMRVSLEQLSQIVGVPVSDVRLATDDEVLARFTDCEPGVVPPFGRLYGLRTVVDNGLSEVSDIVVGANTRHEGLRMHFSDFQALEEPVRASFGRPIAQIPATVTANSSLRAG